MIEPCEVSENYRLLKRSEPVEKHLDV